MIEVDKLLSVAKDAAYEAGEIQMSFYNKKKDISFKNNQYDLVTNVDKMSEEKIISIIRGHFSDHNIIGEESGEHSEFSSDYNWVIDPIDGTTNYTHNFPHFAVSIGLEYKKELCVGVVFDACKNELFWAAKGVGAYLNAELISVSNTQSLSSSLLATGFPYHREEVMQKNLCYFKNFLYKTQALRRPGAASLDLCYVACGRLDGFWEMSLSPWDTAAGACIIQEAGGKVTNFEGNKFDIYTKNLISSNGFIHEEMREVISNCPNDL